MQTKAIKNKEHSFEFIAGKSIYNLKAVYIKELEANGRIREELAMFDKQYLPTEEDERQKVE